MSNREQTEAAIRETLATETDAIRLSDKLFHPDGLFGRLAATEQERRSLVQTPLFAEALRRLSQLQRSEADEFGRAVAGVRGEGQVVSRLVRTSAE